AASAAAQPAAAAQPEAASAAASDADAKKRAIIAAALERARKKKEELAAQGDAPKNTAGVSAAVQAQIDAAEARRKRLADQQAQEPGAAAPEPDDGPSAPSDKTPR
ncbi:ferredoxin, partial [Burkholderia sp. SRS-46]